MATSNTPTAANSEDMDSTSAVDNMGPPSPTNTLTETNNRPLELEPANIIDPGSAAVAVEPVIMEDATEENPLPDLSEEEDWMGAPTPSAPPEHELIFNEIDMPIRPALPNIPTDLPSYENVTRTRQNIKQQQ